MEVEASLLESALAWSPESVSLYERDGTVLYMNAATERIMGVCFEDVQGKRLFELYPDAIGTEFHTAFQRAARGEGPQQFEHYYPRFDGWFANHVELVGEHVHVYARDVSARVHSDRRTATLARISDALTRSDHDIAETARQVTRILSEVTEADCTIALLTADAEWLETLARSTTAPAAFNLLDGIRRWRADIGNTAQALRERRPLLEVINRVTADQDGKVHAVLAHYDPGSVVIAPLVVDDTVIGTLTASRRRAQSVLTNQDKALLAEVAPSIALYLSSARRRSEAVVARQQTFDEAQRARLAAEEANRSKDEFLAMLGHELRNPLAPLVTALELMRLQGNMTFAREHAVIRRQVQHLTRLVDDLLDVSRITRGKVELRRELLDLDRVIASAVEQTSPVFDERRHHLVIDVPSGLGVFGDATRLAQVFANVLTNAAKYTLPGGRVEVSARQVGLEIAVRVRDSGIGISPEMLPQVFELFVQAPQSSERSRGGLGLGLTIVRNLVELHGGHVNIASEGLGQGTELTITLPAAAAAGAHTDVAAAATLQTSATPRRVLVVDDNEDAAVMLADVLTAYGHDARTAFDGPSALRLAGEFQPEVAVLDIGLPLMDGYDLAERLLRSPDHEGLRLIAVTGYGQDADRERSLAAGFQAHLAKPIRIQTLVRLVEGR